MQCHTYQHGSQAFEALGSCYRNASDDQVSNRCTTINTPATLTSIERMLSFSPHITILVTSRIMDEQHHAIIAANLRMKEWSRWEVLWRETTALYHCFTAFKSSRLFAKIYASSRSMLLYAFWVSGSHQDMVQAVRAMDRSCVMRGHSRTFLAHMSCWGGQDKILQESSAGQSELLTLIDHPRSMLICYTYI